MPPSINGVSSNTSFGYFRLHSLLGVWWASLGLLLTWHPKCFEMLPGFAVSCAVWEIDCFCADKFLIYLTNSSHSTHPLPSLPRSGKDLFGFRGFSFAARLEFSYGIHLSLRLFHALYFILPVYFWCKLWYGYLQSYCQFSIKWRKRDENGWRLSVSTPASKRT